jgi:YjbE family integral membrane protein
VEFNTQTLIAIAQIIWIDILLSGDNAVVIALACRKLPAHQRRMGVVLGAGTAVALRIFFAMIISWLLEIPLLGAVGGVLLFWIAVKLVTGEDEEAHVSESETLWDAVRTIAIADAVMSLDNVVAIAAASHGNVWLFTFGLIVSIPLIVMGSTLIMAMIARFPLFVWAGAALLGWIGGEMITRDRWLMEKLGQTGTDWHIVGAIVGAVTVVLIALLLRFARTRQRMA